MESRSDTLVGPRLRLRPAQPADAAALAGLLLDDRVARWLPHGRAAITADTVSRTLANRCSIPATSLDFVIVRHADDRIIGELVVDDRSGELGYWLGADFWRCRYATEALSIFLAHALHHARFPYLRARVHRDNIPSRCLLERTRFVFVGLEWEALGGVRTPWLHYRRRL
jgi:RimJ/RimL family protein N-acetyltransferase